MVMSAYEFDDYVEEELVLEAEQNTSTYRAPILFSSVRKDASLLSIM